jgi:hypothetical protein
MRYRTANRVMSLSFERDPNEHADVILSGGKQFMRVTKSHISWFAVVGATLFGLVLGLLLELYRRFVLPLVLDAEVIAPLPVILSQLLPFLLLVSGLILGRSLYLNELRKQSVAAELKRGLFIDTDVYADGIETTSDSVTVWMPWHAVRDVIVGKRGIEILGDAFVVYLPERAFKDREDYSRAFQQFLEFWKRSKIADIIDQQPSLVIPLQKLA